MAKTAATKTPAKKTAAKKTAAETAAPKPKVGSPAKAEMPPPNHDQIARTAYRLWEEAGRPHGQSDLFWQRAERELRGLGPQQPAR